MVTGCFDTKSFHVQVVLIQFRSFEVYQQQQQLQFIQLSNNLSLCRAQNNGQQVAGPDDRLNIFCPDKPQFWPVKILQFFGLMEYWLTLAIDRCIASTFSFFRWQSRWKIHSHVLELLSAVFARFHARYTLSIIVRRCLKSPRFVPYLHIGKTWSFSLLGTWSKVSSTKKNNTKYFW